MASMNAGQRVILGVGLVVVAVMCLVPPWQALVTWRSYGEGAGMTVSSEHTESLGYSPVFAPPVNGGERTDDDLRGARSVRVREDVGTLLLQVISVAALCAALLLTAGGRGKDGGA